MDDIDNNVNDNKSPNNDLPPKAPNAKPISTPVAKGSVEFSPPGMKLRSGRKKKQKPTGSKRRRDELDETDNDDDGVEEDQQEQRKKMKLGKDDSHLSASTNVGNVDPSSATSPMDAHVSMNNGVEDVEDVEDVEMKDNIEQSQSQQHHRTPKTTPFQSPPSLLKKSRIANSPPPQFNASASPAATTMKTAATTTDVAVAAPSITNVHLRLPSQHTPAKSKHAAITADNGRHGNSSNSNSNDSTIMNETTVSGGMNGNTRIRNIYTPAVKKVFRRSQQGEKEDEDELLHNHNHGSNGNGSSISIESQLGKTLFDKQRQQNIDTTTTTTLPPSQLEEEEVQQEGEEGEDFIDDKTTPSIVYIGKVFPWMIVIYIMIGIYCGGSIDTIVKKGVIGDFARLHYDIYNNFFPSTVPVMVEDDSARSLLNNYTFFNDGENLLVGSNADGQNEDVGIEGDEDGYYEYDEDDEEEIELEPIIQIEEVIEEEIIYVEEEEGEEEKVEKQTVNNYIIDNKSDLVQREKHILRQRKLIQNYQEEKEFIDTQEESLKETLLDIKTKAFGYREDELDRYLEYSNQIFSVELTKKSSGKVLKEAESLISSFEDTMRNIFTLQPNDPIYMQKLLTAESEAAKIEKSPILSIPLDEMEFFMDASSIKLPGQGCNGRKYIIKTSNIPKPPSPKSTKKKKTIDIDPNLVDEEDVIARAQELNEHCRFVLGNETYSSNIFQLALNWFINISKTKLKTLQQIVPLPGIERINIPLTENLIETQEAIVGFSTDDVQLIINDLLEVEMADTNGQYDFASVVNGARVIRSGSRKTSRSIVENLPLINRGLSKASLKFYGHGAEAALIPTFPKTALGQCWSFEAEETRKQLTMPSVEYEEERLLIENDPDRGEYATLTVALSRPINVDSIVVEHPSKILSPKSETSAIRKFRLVGFIDQEARGNPWQLGTFEYQADGKYNLGIIFIESVVQLIYQSIFHSTLYSDEIVDALQEFRVKDVDESGLPLPKLSSISLAIDSNWGGDLSCLYRFRVQGN